MGGEWTSTGILTAKWFIKLWTVGFFCTGLVCAILFQVPEILALRSNSSTATGVVVRYESSSHGTAVVRFVVSGRTYEKTFGGTPREAGRSIEIYYLPSYPKIALTENPGPALRPALVYTTIGATFLSTAMVLILYRRRAAVVASTS
jgi:hypothetical protein